MEQQRNTALPPILTQKEPSIRCNRSENNSSNQEVLSHPEVLSQRNCDSVDRTICQGKLATLYLSIMMSGSFKK